MHFIINLIRKWLIPYVLIFSGINIAAQADTIIYCSLSDYKLVSTIEIIDDYKIKLSRDRIVEQSSFQINNEFIDFMLYDNFHEYVTDRYDSSNSKFISIINQDSIRIRGYHLFFDDMFLIVTPLKNLNNIKDHFTLPLLFCLDNSLSDYCIPQLPRLELLISNPIIDSVYYISYNNNAESSYASNYEAEIVDICSKVDFPADPRLYVYNSIDASLSFENGIIINVPVFLSSELDKFKNKEKNVTREIFSNLGVSDYFIEIHRYNPGRSRVINKVYQDDIKGQVSTFKIYSLDVFLNQYCN